MNPPNPTAPLPSRRPTRFELREWWSLRPWRCRALVLAFCACPPSDAHPEGCMNRLRGVEKVIGFCTVCDGTHVWSMVGV